MRLGKRLQQINQMITGSYDHIWDCCCDHGFLGAALCKRGAAANIHFVDVVPNLMQALATKLQHYTLPQSLQHTQQKTPQSKLQQTSMPSHQIISQWHTHCLDAAKIPLQNHAGKHLLIIAGVGGDLTAELVKAICVGHPQRELEFILCPVRQQFLLRQQLIELGCELIEEVLVSENNRYYEVLQVRKPRGGMPANAETSLPERPLHSVGETLWHATSKAHETHLKAYLANTLRHHQAAGNRAAVAAYSAVRITHNE